MPMYNLLEYSKKYSKKSGNLQQYFRGEPHNPITDSESYKFKAKITGSTSNNASSKNAEMV